MMLMPPGRLKWCLFMCSIRAPGLCTRIEHMLQVLLMSTFDTEIEVLPLRKEDWTALGLDCFGAVALTLGCLAGAALEGGDLAL